MERPTYGGIKASCQQPRESTWERILQLQLSLQGTSALVNSLTVTS